ncbi:membrane protein [Parafrankia irregularis]|uniref:Membrane protein n=1 Tax=Parafrankia irregularis TaxID=795642 RepID=A0A0S4QWJ2_9ACTN|nr:MULTISPECIES: ribonuclease BN [Parafrankia]CUU59593.1 membrane protein [Parafrankia irregularis]
MTSNRFGPFGRVGARLRDTLRLGVARRRMRRALRGDLASRLRAADLINGAMNLAALILMMFFPFVIALAAASPLGAGGAADIIIRRMGLNHDAAMAVERLFTPRSGTTVSGWSVLGVLWLVLGGVSLAASIQVVYERVFRLSPAGLRGLRHQVIWLSGLLVFLAGSTALGAVLTGTAVGQVGYALVVVVMTAMFLWAGARVLTMGRLSWRSAWPVAFFTTIGLTGLGGFSRLTFSATIVSNESTYGPIGVVFTILSWLIGFGVVMIGGAVVGSWYVEAGVSVIDVLKRISTDSRPRHGQAARQRHREP